MGGAVRVAAVQRQPGNDVIEAGAASGQGLRAGFGGFDGFDQQGGMMADLECLQGSNCGICGGA
jgi:hypothetical protein